MPTNLIWMLVATVAIVASGLAFVWVAFAPTREKTAEKPAPAAPRDQIEIFQTTGLQTRSHRQVSGKYLQIH